MLTVTSASGTSSADLKGVKGDKGEKGDTGAQGIQGEPGEKGEKGDKGDKGDTGAQGESGKDGTSATHSWNGTVLTISSASGTSSADLKGAKGDKGDKGNKGDTGDQGIQGIQGPKGDTGAPGMAWKGIYNNTTNYSAGDVVYLDGTSYIATVDIIQDGQAFHPEKDDAWEIVAQQGANGANGASITVKSVSESSTDGGSNVVTFSDGKTLTIKNGTKGSTGATGSQGPKGDTGSTGATGQRGTGLLPVTTGPSSYTTAVGGITPKYRMALSTIKTQAGVTEVLLGDTVQYSYYHYPIDYMDASYAYFTTRVSIRGADGATGADGKDYVLTEADKAELVAMVIESLGGNPIFGTVDANNNIVVSGNLPDGTYSVKYEMEDGSTINIGNLVLDTNVYYTVTNSLTNCTSNNSATKAVQGGSYSATITAKSGYELSSIKVTMGGTDISSTAVSGGKISIANVTGNIVITAVAEEVTVEIVNLIPISTNADGSLYKGAKGESGYKLKTRVKLSNGDEAVHNSSVCTGFMPCKYNDTLYIKGITVVNDINQTNEALCFYNSNHAFIASVHAGKALGAVSGGVASVKFNETGTGKTEINSSAGIAYFRLSANTIDSNSVITINQPL